MAKTKTGPTILAKLRIAESVWCEVKGATLEEFEESLRLTCRFAESCKFNRVAVWEKEDAFDIQSAFYKELRDKFRELYGKAGVNLLLTPECDFYKKIYDAEEHAFRDGAPVGGLFGIKCLGTPESAIEDVFSDAPVPAKAAKAEEGTTKLSSKMSPKELIDAAEEGGVKTVDLDDYEDFKDLVAKAREEMNEKMSSSK